MTDLTPIFNEMQLSEPQKTAELNWIEEKSKQSLVPVEKLQELYTNKFKEMVAVKLNEAIPQNEFLECLHGMVACDMREHVPPKPGIMVEFMPIGQYAPRIFKDNITQDIIGYAKQNGNNPMLTLVTCSKDKHGDNIIKLADMQLLEVYNLEVVPAKEKTNMLAVQAYLHSNSTFTPDKVIKESIFGASKEDRLNFVLNQILYTGLATANMKLSQLQASKNKKTQYPNSADLRMIQVSIADYDHGKDGSTGREWGHMIVNDSSMVPTQERKGFDVWIDPALVRKVGAGPKSFVKLIGTLQHSKDQKQVQMTAAGIYPIIKVELQETTQAPQLGGGTNPFASATGVTNIDLGKGYNIST